MSDPKWLELARADLGTKEIVGKLHNKKVVAYYGDAGHPEIDLFLTSPKDRSLERFINRPSESIQAIGCGVFPYPIHFACLY